MKNPTLKIRVPNRTKTGYNQKSVQALAFFAIYGRTYFVAAPFAPKEFYFYDLLTGICFNDKLVSRNNFDVDEMQKSAWALLKKHYPSEAQIVKVYEENERFFGVIAYNVKKMQKWQQEQ